MSRTRNTADLVSLNAINVSGGNVGIGTDANDNRIYVEGDARITGILTVGTASITLDPNAKTLTGLEELQIGSGNTAITIKKSEITGEIEFADTNGKESSIGIGTTVSINTSGIVTATSFSGSLATSDLTGTITNAQLAGSIADDKLSSTFLKNTVEDTTPQLGGNLDINSNYITGTGGINVSGVVTATSFTGGTLTASAAFYMPQYTTTARDAASFNEGAMIYNTTTKKMEFYNGSSWQSLPGMSLGLTVALDG